MVVDMYKILGIDEKIIELSKSVEDKIKDEFKK